MTTTADKSVAHYHLRAAAEHMNVSYFDLNDGSSGYHLKRSRESLVKALGFEDESDMYDTLIYGCNNTEEMMEKLLQRFM